MKEKHKEGIQCSTLVSVYLDKYKRSVFFSPALLYVYVYMAPQFCKISFIARFFVSGTDTEVCNEF